MKISCFISKSFEGNASKLLIPEITAEANRYVLYKKLSRNEFTRNLILIKCY